MAIALLDVFLEVAFAAAGILLIVGAWVAVQRAWARQFPGVSPDPDVLADRIDCGACADKAICTQATAGSATCRTI